MSKELDLTKKYTLESTEEVEPEDEEPVFKNKWEKMGDTDYQHWLKYKEELYE